MEFIRKSYIDRTTNSKLAKFLALARSKKIAGLQRNIMLQQALLMILK